MEDDNKSTYIIAEEKIEEIRVDGGTGRQKAESFLTSSLECCRCYCCSVRVSPRACPRPFSEALHRVPRIHDLRRIATRRFRSPRLYAVAPASSVATTAGCDLATSTYPWT